jgi:hypothetical protein
MKEPSFSSPRLFHKSARVFYIRGKTLGREPRMSFDNTGSVVGIIGCE